MTTTLFTCCSSAQGIHRGDWYFPNGIRLPVPHRDATGSVESRGYKRVDLRRVSGFEPSGIYHCDIPTNAVHDNGLRETVYVGVYASGGTYS